MKVRDVIKMGSIVETLVALDKPGTLCLPERTIGRVTGKECRQGKRYWVVSFPLPQADAFSVMLYSEEHPDREVFYQTHELRKVRGKEPRPLPLMVARFIDAGEQYALYEVTRDERLLHIQSVVELGAMSFADLPVQAVTGRSQVQQFCADRGWHLFYKEGDQSYHYQAELTWRVEEDDVLVMHPSGTVLAATAEEAHQNARRVLLRDYPPEEYFSGHEGVQIEEKEAVE